MFTARIRAGPVTGREGGQVTVEAAIALSALLAVFGLILAGLGAIVDQLRCTDAAREAARLVARGQRHLATEAVRTIGPDGARLAIRAAGEGVTIAVAEAPGTGSLPGVRAHAEAYALLEPGVRPPPEVGGSTDGLR
ncbi:TadE family type IV pilus minor pilin [Amycolatopsis cihanbeyliensis]|uniref:TadE-like protein n=1 Tax=Amycolatopsis cihanbeyliensis TaxID=1128664 RepID=A0A542DMZ8_AMYCI|nr:TadE family type IV pilus minor pilin [Amycolatopsis cihanbeyliensis]TQJ04469.1 TadE-like protein [Amycolatopsis cihanbeyliensis]